MSLAAQCLSVLLQSFSQSWKMFCIIFLFVGASQISIYISAFVLGKHANLLKAFTHRTLFLVEWSVFAVIHVHQGFVLHRDRGVE